MKHETAGDPVTGLKWTRRTPGKIAAALWEIGIEVSGRTVARFLKGLGFSLRANRKQLSSGSGRDRDEQFVYIAEMRERFARQGLPIVSVDGKKKEMIGRFKNGGTAWSRDPILVHDHDFRSEASGRAVPYGVYDVEANLGSLFVGLSRETPDFAVDSLVKWWIYDGRTRYPDASRLLVLADSGGSSSPRNRAWKYAAAAV